MKIHSLLVLTLSAGALCAEAPGLALDARVQVFGEITRPVEITVANVGAATKDQPERQTGIGLRFLGEIASAPHFYYEVGGKFDSSSHFTLNGPTAMGSVLDLTGVKYTHSYWSVGAAYLYQPTERFSLGVHLEGRGEALHAKGPVYESQVSKGTVDLGTTYLRPWVRLSADVTLPVGSMRPYVGVDVSGAITKTSQTSFVSINQMDGRTLKSLAPAFAASCYLGMRF